MIIERREEPLEFILIDLTNLELTNLNRNEYFTMLIDHTTYIK